VEVAAGTNELLGAQITGGQSPRRCGHCKERVVSAAPGAETSPGDARAAVLRVCTPCLDSGRSGSSDHAGSGAEGTRRANTPQRCFGPPKALRIALPQGLCLCAAVQHGGAGGFAVPIALLERSGLAAAQPAVVSSSDCYCSRHGVPLGVDTPCFARFLLAARCEGG